MKAFQALFFLLTLTTCLQISAQVKVTNIKISELPAQIKYKGEIKQAVRWTDNNGENIVITTETGIYDHPNFEDENEGSQRDAELFAYHFIVEKDSLIQTWKVYDFIKNCPFDVTASFIENTFQVTDLNKDGVAEIWLMYKTVCQSDVSPCNMKIIMLSCPEIAIQVNP